MSEFVKQYYWQLMQFKQCDSGKFKEITCLETAYIYLFKKMNPDVIVRIKEPTEKIHCWAFREIQILQRLNDNPRVFHWKYIRLPFKGQLILSHLSDFNRILKDEIQFQIPRRTQALDKWLDREIDDAFLINFKSKQNFGNEHAFLEVKTIYRTRYRNYFEMRRWRGKDWQGLLDIADAQGISRNGSFGMELQQINSFICNYEVINSQKYQSMFKEHGRVQPKKERPKDKYDQMVENKVMQKYHLYEYIDI